MGVNFLYGFGAQFRILSVTSPTEAQVEIIDPIYPTVILGIANTSAFRVGDIVQTDVTQVRGVVAAVGAGTVTVALTSGYSLPDVDTEEPLVGQGGSEQITSVTQAPAPAGITI